MDRIPQLAGLLVALSVSNGCQTRPIPADAPRLVVLASIDQLPNSVLRSAWPHFGTGGFRRLAREGVDFASCSYRHGCTETGPGHATLSTGAPARVHGVVLNEWFYNGAPVYCAQPAGADSMGPGNLLVPTLGDLMKRRFGAASRVVSVSWKDRAAILLGGASADLAVWVNSSTGIVGTWSQGRQQGAPDWLHLDDWYDKLQNAPDGSRRIWRKGFAASAYAGLVDDRKHEKPAPYIGAVFPHTVVEPGLATDVLIDRIRTSPLGNSVVAMFARKALEHYELGRDATPDLLCVSFSANDLVGHTFGPRSVEVRDILLRTDAEIAGLLAHLDRVVGKGRYLFLLSSDHGVGPVPAIAAQEHGVKVGYSVSLQAANRARVALRRAYPEICAAIENPVAHADSLSLWLAPELRGKPEAVNVAARAAQSAPGVRRAYSLRVLLRTRGESKDPIEAAMRQAVHAERSGDVILVPERYWIDSPNSTAAHGSPYDYDREVPLFALGSKVRQGHRELSPVAPGLTVAIATQLLDIETPDYVAGPVPAATLTR